MRSRAGLLLALLALAAPRLPAQGEGVRRVACRVTAVDPGKGVLIDRGTRDLVKEGDAVEFRPRGAAPVTGRVTAVTDRSATVEVVGVGAMPPTGTRGEVLLPEGRKAPAPEAGGEAVPPVPDKPGPGGEEGPGRTPPTFRNQDEGFRQGQPLLVGMRPRRPAERATRVVGRGWFIGDLVKDQDDWDNSLVRLGSAATIENPFGHGGNLGVDFEFNYKTETNLVRGTDLLVRELAYDMGGTRFDADGFVFGRFLQRGLPELQYLDGAEWIHRTEGGDRYGASAGFMPVPDEDFDTGDDFQLALWYEWVDSLEEELVLTAAYQKTFHHGNADRDLLLAKVRYLPRDAWRFQGNLWVDFYLANGDAGKPSVEVTEAWLSLSRDWDDGSGTDLTFRHSVLPYMQRFEFVVPITFQELLDSRYDVLSLDLWSADQGDGRTRGTFAAWIDEDDVGGSAEVGEEFARLLSVYSTTELSLYGNVAKGSNGLGARLWHRVTGPGLNWSLLYDFSYRHFPSIADDRDDLLQHRARLTGDLDPWGGADLHLYGEARLYDEELTWSLGFYLQWRF
ncbi:MAG: hypothetical protein R3F30_03640 [Planctomycetota bacterium]